MYLDLIHVIWGSSAQNSTLSIGSRPRIQALPSVVQAPDQRWATDLCRIWDGWLTLLALVIDCYTRQLRAGSFLALARPVPLRPLWNRL